MLHEIGIITLTLSYIFFSATILLFGLNAVWLVKSPLNCDKYLNRMLNLLDICTLLLGSMAVGAILTFL